ncbi:hypothetical protein V2W45_1463678 [Cenococcum geophilum]
MDIIQWYLVGLGLVALFITASPLLKTIKFARTYAIFYFYKLIRRSRLMSTINLTPLRYRIRLRRVAIVKGLIYTAAAISLRKPNLRTYLDAAITIAIVLLSSVASIRQYAYKIFSKLHLILGAIVIAIIYLYSPSKELLTPLAIFIAVLQFSQVLYRNVKIRQIAIKIPYRREIPIPDAWYRDAKGNNKRSRFTRSLFLYANNNLVHNSKIRAVIKGPYRNKLNLELYRTVLLFATGIGILLEGCYNCEELDSKLKLLSRDINKLFILGDIIYLRERISITYTIINAKSLIRSKIEGQKGLCINNKTSNKIREIV